MCSFLLLFLLIVVGFDLLQNSNPYWNAKEARQAFAPASAASLVLTPHGCGDFESFCATTSAAHFGRSSFQGFAVFERVDKQIMEQELWPWRCARCQRINKKNALKCAMCQAHWTSGTRHNTQPKQQLAQQGEASWNNWTEWSQEWDEWKDADANWRWDGARPDPSQDRSLKPVREATNRNPIRQRARRTKAKARGKVAKELLAKRPLEP